MKAARLDRLQVSSAMRCCVVHSMGNRLSYAKGLLIQIVSTRSPNHSVDYREPKMLL